MMVEPEIVMVDLDLDVDGDYKRFIDILREKLAHHPLRDQYIATYGAWLEDHPLLPEQRTPRQPARWMYINIKFQDTNGTIGTTIAVRDDNVYLIGFKNGNGDWYEFGVEGRSKPFIEGSIFLGCDVSYRDLVGDSAELVDLRLGKYEAKSAVRTLWAYKRQVRADVDTREHLARMCVMICESARMIPHYNVVNGGWNNGGTRINLQHAEYITNWSRMSSKLLSMRDPSPEREHLLGVVHLVLNSPAKKGTQGRQQQQEQSPPPEGGGPSKRRRGNYPQALQTSSSRPTASSGGGGTQRQGRTAGNSVRGRPLVQVYRVDAVLSVGIDTVVVFDGKRGQIIYKHDDHAESPSRTRYRIRRLELTGPYRAISADGSFVIQVDSILVTNPLGKSRKVTGELFWDCYAEDVEYDKVLTTCVINSQKKKRKKNTDSGGRLVEVTYEVLSDAVEATVEVNLLVPGITHVYGHILGIAIPELLTSGFAGLCASYGTVEYRRNIPLFERERGQKVELVPSSDDLMVPLELRRSVIAVPVHTKGSFLWIWVQLHAVTPNNEDDVPLKGGIGFYFDKHTGGIAVSTSRDFFVPVGWTGGSDPTGSSGATTSAGHEGTEQTSVQQCKVQVNVTSPGFHISSHKLMLA